MIIMNRQPTTMRKQPFITEKPMNTFRQATMKKQHIMPTSHMDTMKRQNAMLTNLLKNILNYTATPNPQGVFIEKQVYLLRLLF
jgi:hypothetical protein